MAITNLIVLAATAVMAPLAAAADKQERMLFVYLHDRHLVDSATLAGAKPMVARMVAEIGVRVQWRTGDPRPQLEQGCGRNTPHDGTTTPFPVLQPGEKGVLNLTDVRRITWRKIHVVDAGPFDSYLPEIPRARASPSRVEGPPTSRMVACAMTKRVAQHAKSARGDAGLGPNAIAFVMEA